MRTNYRAQNVAWAFVGGVFSGSSLNRLVAGTFHRDVIANSLTLVVGICILVLALAPSTERDRL